MSPAIELEGVQSNDSNPRYLEPLANSNQSRFARHTFTENLPSTTRTSREIEAIFVSFQGMFSSYITLDNSNHVQPPLSIRDWNKTDNVIQYKTFTLPCDFCSSLEFHFQPDFSPLLNLIKLFIVWIEKTINTSFFPLISGPFLSLSITRTLFNFHWRFKLSKFDCTS